MARHRAVQAAVGLMAGAGIVVAIVLLLMFGPTASQPAGRSAVRERAVRPASCAERLLKDWSDGRIDGTYRVACYRKAIKELPTDLVVYSSAEEDIRRALSERIVQNASAAERAAATSEDSAG